MSAGSNLFLSVAEKPWGNVGYGPSIARLVHFQVYDMDLISKIYKMVFIVVICGGGKGDNLGNLLLA
jgi:hypothetical protein